MAIWGPKIYQNDVAEDIRFDFKDLLRRGNNARQITDQFIQKYGCEIEDDEDASIFWFALADTQWNLGMLLPEVKEKALELLSSGADLQFWEQQVPKEAKVRARFLADLDNKLNSPQPPIKKLPQYKLYRCEWRIGDTFAYRMESDYALEKGLLGHYLILQKVDEYIWHPGHVIPIVRIKMTEDTQLPQDESQIILLPYIIMYHPEKSGQANYLAKMVSTSKQIIPKKLILLGNYTHILPLQEYIPEKFNVYPILWKNFEKIAIDRYFSFAKPT